MLAGGTLLFDGNKLTLVEKNGMLWKSWEAGIKDVIELETADGGSILLTPEHKIATEEDGWIEAGLALNKTFKMFNNYIYKGDLIVDDRVALVGLLCGRAMTHSKTRLVTIKIKPDEPELVELLMGFDFKEFGGSSLAIDKIHLNLTEEELKLLEDFRDLDKFPDWFMEKEANYIASFLRGFFEGRAWLVPTWRSITVKLQTKELARQFKILLSLFGIFSILRRRTDGGYYMLSISHYKDLEAYSRLVGFVCDSKWDKLQEILDNRTEFVERGMKPKIVKITPRGRMTVYDFAMINTGKRYNVANGGYIIKNGGLRNV